MADNIYDVVVVGAGNAALSAAIAAKENCESVLVIEKAPEYFRGGNTYFTGGIIRFPFNGIDDIQAIIPDMSETEANSIEVGSYTEDQYYEDMMSCSSKTNKMHFTFSYSSTGSSDQHTHIQIR